MLGETVVTAPPPTVRVRAARHSDYLERHGLVLFVGGSALYWAVTAVLAARKLMWNDELYTYYVATLPSMSDVWAALLTGAEQTPPFFYFITRLSFALFGVNNISARLPEMLGFWIMSVCLLVFVRRRTSWYPALCAAAVPLVTTAYPYALEARPYGLVLGLAAVALVSWQSAVIASRRRVALVSLAVSLCGAVSIHYYAVFVILPLALGEATRAITSRRLDLAIWVAFASPVVPLLVHLPLLRAGRSYSGAFWSPPQWVNIPDFYFHLLTPTLVVLAVIVVLTVVHAVIVEDGHAPDMGQRAPSLPVHEIVAACGFILIPFVCVVLAKVAIGAFTHRYAMPAVLGFAVVAGFGSAAVFARKPVMRAATVACLVGWFALSQARELIYPTGYSLPVAPNNIRQAAEWLKAVQRPGLPLVVADPHTFTVLSHYGAPEIKARMVYLADPVLALKQLGHNSVERGMLDLLKPWFRMNVVAFESFVAEHPQFLVFGDFYELGFLNWITPELQRRGMRLELLNRAGDHLFLLASRK